MTDIATRQIAPEDPVQYLPGVGPARAAALAKLGIRTVADLLRHYPREYADRRRIGRLRDVRTGETQLVRVELLSLRRSRTRRKGLTIAEALVRDSSGAVATAVWFGPAYRTARISPGTQLILEGRWQFHRSKPAVFEVADHEILDGADDPIHTARIVPKHPATAEVPARRLRVLVHRAIQACADRMSTAVPDDVRLRRGWPPLPEALRMIHFPNDMGEAARAREFLAFEELFLFQAAMAIRRRAEVENERVPPLIVDARVDARIRARFPFRLTPGQERAVAAIRADLASGRPMNRLLQGDVGCGKTVVAAYAMLAAVWHRRQAALMAPTEILAEQHRQTFERWLEGSRVRIGFFGRGLGKRERARLRAALAEGALDIAIGTHALVQEDVAFRDLAVVVIDEQQKFGVLQRRDLAAKGWRPHVLVMTATPIPRTLAMTLFGDLDVSTIPDMPPGRKPVETIYVPAAARRKVFEMVRAEIAEGRQAYFVYPLIDASDRLPLRSAKRMWHTLREEFPFHRVGLLHGAMAKKEKDEVMEEFRSGRMHILVSTVVVEVGVDVPNASVMVVDHAERYGLSQLHQLRGRIGRGPHRSKCILVADARTAEAQRRIEAMVQHRDGFRLAEVDLELRGPGDFLGTRQHGLPEFRLADLARDVALAVAAREEAWEFARRDPDFRTPEGRKIRQAIVQMYGERLALGGVG